MNSSRFLWAVAVFLCAAPAYAFDCPYFRVALHVAHCAQTSEKQTSMPDYSGSDLDVPDIGRGADKPFIKVVCSCDYSLSGSDPRCDLDRHEEQSTILPVDDVKASCRRGIDLCDALCPAQRRI